VQKNNTVMPTTYPNVAFGTAKQSTAKRYYLRMLRYGQMRRILEETDVLVKNGKISAIGKIFQTLLLCSDAKGKHLTSGIIDEHSHIAISNGVNEGGHNSSAEVTIQDVVNSEDINIYRELGGVTSQLLHGSANLGGQSAIVRNGARCRRNAL
jgi:cytosine/adenosine deaminase-related metal-dependent hydrolase